MCAVQLMVDRSHTRLAELLFTRLYNEDFDKHAEVN